MHQSLVPRKPQQRFWRETARECAGGSRAPRTACTAGWGPPPRRLQRRSTDAATHPPARPEGRSAAAGGLATPPAGRRPCAAGMAMRYNDRDVAYFARNARIKPDRTGTLLKRGETNTAYKQRHFVLKGNLLFYFKNANVRLSPPPRAPAGAARRCLRPRRARPPALSLAFAGHDTRRLCGLGGLPRAAGRQRLPVHHQLQHARIALVPARGQGSVRGGPGARTRRGVPPAAADRGVHASAGRGRAPAMRPTSGSWRSRPPAGTASGSSSPTCRRRWSGCGARCPWPRV